MRPHPGQTNLSGQRRAYKNVAQREVDYKSGRGDRRYCKK